MINKKAETDPEAEFMWGQESAWDELIPATTQDARQAMSTHEVFGMDTDTQDAVRITREEDIDSTKFIGFGLGNLLSKANASPNNPGSGYDKYRGEELPASDTHPISQPQPMDNTSGTAHGSLASGITRNQVLEWFRDLNPFEDEGVYADDVIDVFIVGSEAKGTATPTSDIDIAVVIPPISGKTALQVSEGFHMAYGDALPFVGDREVDLQFFYEDDPELKDYSKISLAGIQDNTSFMSWFGDSKVVDSEGNPMVVYHGTHESFTEFTPPTKSGVDFEPTKQQIFFASTPEGAEGYAYAKGANIMPVYLKVSKLFDRVEDESPEMTSFRNFLVESEKVDVNQAWDFADAVVAGNYDARESKEFVAWLQANDYDGYTVKEGSGSTNWSYAVFNSNQIKSATGNSGDFDAESADITAGIQDNTSFMSWFGDSKVVDSEGNPRVVYHGTADDITEFDTQKSAMGVFWFTSDKASVESGEVGASGHGNIVEAYLTIKNPAGWDEYDKFSTGELIGKGYDGVILEGDGEETYIVFEPNQIKSATGNSGDFDSESADIRASVVPNKDLADDRESMDDLIVGLNGSMMDGMGMPPACKAFNASVNEQDGGRPKSK